MCNFQDFSKKHNALRFQSTTKNGRPQAIEKSGAKGRFTMIPMKPLHQQQIQGRVLRWPHLKKKTVAEGIHPQSLTKNLKMVVSKRDLLFQWAIFRFHVELQGCTP